MALDLFDFKFIEFSSGKKIAYRATCDKCGDDRGYLSRYQGNKSKYCRPCSRYIRNLPTQEDKLNFSNVDFNTALTVQEGNKTRTLFKCVCLMCGQDRGFVRKNRWTDLCRSCCQKGKKHTIETRKRNSSAKQGITIEQFVDFKTQEKKKLRVIFDKSGLALKCFELVNFTCTVCCKRGGDLNAHHLYSWHTHPELRFDLNNLVCLCVNCHRSFHKTHGHRNNTKDQFLSFKNKNLRRKSKK